MTYAWLVLAILFEAGWAVAMKLSNGLTRPGPAAVTVVFYLLSVVFLSFATKRMDVGVAYGVWAGSGVILIAFAGMTWFKEPISAMKVFSIAIIAAGIFLLQKSTAGH